MENKWSDSSWLICQVDSSNRHKTNTFLVLISAKNFQFAFSLNVDAISFRFINDIFKFIYLILIPSSG